VFSSRTHFPPFFNSAGFRVQHADTLSALFEFRRFATVAFPPFSFPTFCHGGISALFISAVLPGWKGWWRIAFPIKVEFRTFKVDFHEFKVKGGGGGGMEGLSASPYIYTNFQQSHLTRFLPNIPPPLHLLHLSFFFLSSSKKYIYIYTIYTANPFFILRKPTGELPSKSPSTLPPPVPPPGPPFCPSAAS
jgi:hypothetical protein